MRRKIIAYVKDGGSNFNVMTNALKSIMNYEYINLEEKFKEFVLVTFFRKYVSMAH
jgi:hypothetical protein